MTLDDDDGLVVQMGRDVYAGGLERMDLCLVGKILRTRTAMWSTDLANPQFIPVEEVDVSGGRMKVRVRIHARECLKHSEEEIGDAALKRLRYRSWLRALTSSIRPRTDLNYGRDVSNANPGSSIGVVKETAGVVQVREHRLNENREIEEELEVYGISTVEQLARRREMEMGLTEIGIDGLVNNDGSNVVGEFDLAIMKGGDVVPSTNCVLPAVMQEVIPVKGKKVLDECMTQTTTTITSEDTFTLGKIFRDELGSKKTVSKSHTIVKGGVRKVRPTNSPLKSGLALSPKHAKFYKVKSPCKSRKMRSPFGVKKRVSSDVKNTGGAKRKILEEPVEKEGIGKHLKVGEHGDIDVAIEVSGIISASPGGQDYRET
ncbi:hypothetical protein TorRG33x02_069730 [Trema orientale]|uniref:Uncharacterized protein n=1 Tax=Trema orientale TaxID=63057 RepID=A0A2P5FHD6_TREOI|nr:hypothetical protein TorRG33x02_069730 [Trema orientale]